MTAPADAVLLPAPQLAALLHAYQEQLARLEHHIDPGWLRNFSDGCPPPATAALERALRLRAQLGLAPVQPSAFSVPAQRLALLEKPQLLAVLAARALYAYRTALCRCVDGAALARLREVIGAPALAVLRAAGADARDLAPAPLPAYATLADWAIDGYQQFRRDGVWREPSLQRLIALALPVAASEGGAGGAVSGDSDALIALLPTLFPELAWLFG